MCTSRTFTKLLPFFRGPYIPKGPLDFSARVYRLSFEHCLKRLRSQTFCKIIFLHHAQSREGKEGNEGNQGGGSTSPSHEGRQFIIQKYISDNYSDNSNKYLELVRILTMFQN